MLYVQGREEIKCKEIQRYRGNQRTCPQRLMESKVKEKLTRK